MDSVRPNFLIIGAAKCGTSSLHKYLSVHPEVFCPTMKEIDYFSHESFGCTLSFNEYCKLFEGGKGFKAIGEASPNYMTCPESAQKVCTELGADVKIIALLRNPVDVMHSHWAYCVQRSLEFRNERKALTTSLHGKWDARDWFLHHGSRVRYAEQISRYFNLFKRDNIKVYIFEEFFADGLPLLNDVLNFLSISQDHSVENTAYNKGVTVKNIYIHRLLTQHCKNILPHSIKKIIPADFLRRVGQRLYTFNVAPEPTMIDMALKLELEKELYADVRTLERLLNRDLSRLWF